MTSGAIRIFQEMTDGEAWTVQLLSRATRICRRKVRGTLLGSLMSGLVEDATPANIGTNNNPPPHYRITELGRTELAMYEVFDD